MSGSPNDVGVLANFVTQRGFERIDLSGGGVVTLSPPNLGPIQMFALIQAEGGDARYRDDNSDAPSSAVGFILFEKISLQYNVLDLSKIRFIQADTAIPATNLNVLYYTFASELEIPTPSAFCPFLDLVNFNLSGTPTITIVNNTVTVEGTDFQQASQVGQDAISSTTDIIPFEVKFSNLLPSVNLSIAVYDGDNPTTDGFLAGVGVITNQAAGDIDDIIAGGAPIATVDTRNGYIGGVEFDMATGTARYKDNRGTDLPIDVAGSFSNVNPIFLGMRQSLSAGNGGTFELNAGDKAFEVVSGTRYCKV